MVPAVSKRTGNPGNSQENRCFGHDPGQPHLLWLSGVSCQSSLNCQLAVVSGHLRGQGSQLIRTRHRFGYLGCKSTTITNANTCSSHVGISVKVTILRTKTIKLKLLKKYSIIFLFLYQAEHIFDVKQRITDIISGCTHMTSWLKLIHV